MRRMSPLEVWRPGSRELKPIGPHVAAMIVGQGRRQRAPGPQRRNRDHELARFSGDPLRFDAHHLPPRATYLCVLNPFDTNSLTLFDAKGGYVTTLRITFRSRDDIDARAAMRPRGESAKRASRPDAPPRHGAGAR
jgi:hypothetical protein